MTFSHDTPRGDIKNQTLKTHRGITKSPLQDYKDADHGRSTNTLSVKGTLTAPKML